MRIIVFTDIMGGHNLEYIHHIYEMAINEPKNDYIFLLPQSFEEVFMNLEWKKVSHIRFDIFKKEHEVDTSSMKGLIAGSYHLNKFLLRKIKEHNAEAVFVNELMSFVPMAFLILPRDVKLSGVIYKIYLYDTDNKSKLSEFLDRIKFWLMSNTKVFHRVFVLNAKEGAEKLNKVFHTGKFVALPDPYVPLKADTLPDFRKQYGISPEKKLFVQFGALSTNKSTIEILESLRLLNDEECQHYAFAFCGKVYDEIKECFYQLLKEIDGKVQIVVKDEFCPYETFASVCVASDAILTPYKRTAQSSGLVGYAAQFHRPVIAPNKGLLGDIVRKYELGILVDDIRPESLVSAYRKIATGTIEVPSSRYCDENSIEAFQQVLSTNIS